MADEASTEPLVSVILATNRGGPFLAEALESAVNQTYPRVEVVVVDDGSPDPEELRAAVAVHPGVRLLRTEPRGVSAARNYAVGQSEGDLLVFLDDDDRWHPDRVRQHVALMQRQDDAVLSYCMMRTIDAHGTELARGDQRRARDVHDVIRGRTGIMLPNVVIRRSAFEAIGGFDPAYRQGEDLDLVLKAAGRGPFAFVDAVLVDYRHHSANTTRSHRALATGLRTILGRHREAVRAAGRADLVADYSHRLRANDRFAAWSVARAMGASLRARQPLAALSDLVWLVGFAPTVPVTWLRAKLERSASEPEPDAGDHPRPWNRDASRSTGRA